MNTRQGYFNQKITKNEGRSWRKSVTSTQQNIYENRESFQSPCNNYQY